MGIPSIEDETIALAKRLRLVRRRRAIARFRLVTVQEYL